MELIGLVCPALALVGCYAGLGLPLAMLIGLRGLWAAALTPLLATSVIGISATVAGWVGFRWSLLPPVIVALIIAAGIVVVRGLSGSRGTVCFPARHRWWTWGVAAVAGIVLAVAAGSVIGRPEALSQTFDNIFHLNAIRYALDTGDVSPLAIGRMTSFEATPQFYPTGWHSTAALVVQLSGSSILAAVNAQTIIIAAVIWPLGAILLSRVLIGTTPAVIVAAGVVAVSVPAFPLLMMDYGVLYPYQLALALLPATLAVTACLLGIGDRGSVTPGYWGLLLVGALPGIVIAHPGGFVGWMALSLPMVLAFAAELWRRAPGRGIRAWIVAMLLAYAILGILLLRVLRPPLSTRGWPTVTDLPTAAMRALMVQVGYPSAAWLVGLSVLIGLAWVLREQSSRGFVVAGIWLVGATLFVVVSAVIWQTLRDALTGSWYNNWPRLASLFVIALVPLAALGIARTAEAVHTILRRMAVPAYGRFAVGVLATVLAVPAFASQALPDAEQQAAESFALGADSPLLSVDELTLLKRLDKHVPTGAVVAGNPYTGTSLAFAIANRRVLMPHVLMESAPDVDVINENLDDAARVPQVCEAVDRLGVGYVLDFGEREVHGGSHPLPGLQGLSGSTAVRLVDSEGYARLYEVVACG
ncbi:Permease of the drug/metabolite transporter (DMT) superfamily [Microbacterium esteraromaticum]|uniref:Permease of the drug/metabolite transporter (DMT) superfamily n=2 Tax=Microbacterium esteraromaticum TaxID=57043 RepID=A0A1R4JF52_9MICO|nr:Permease of the drug/metabolite transporter (DMT) superfamily [Microbacterium esteraromaticum]